jgi:hypothetical protein
MYVIVLTHDSGTMHFGNTNLGKSFKWVRGNWEVSCWNDLS